MFFLGRMHETPLGNWHCPSVDHRAVLWRDVWDVWHDEWHDERCGRGSAAPVGLRDGSAADLGGDRGSWLRHGPLLLL
jgi:hypothetical protein